MRVRPDHPPSGKAGILAAMLLLVAGACDGNGTSPRGPASVAIAGGNEQTGTVGDGLNESLALTVFDQDGLTYQGAAVAWAVTVGGGSVNPDTSITNSSGRATTAWTLGTTAGTQRVTATVSGIAPASFSADAEPAPPSQVVITPATVTVGVGVTTTLSAQLQDEYGNPIAEAEFDWSSSDEGIARVDSDGVVTGWGVGTATITASDQGASGTATVTVQEGQD